MIEGEERLSGNRVTRNDVRFEKVEIGMTQQPVIILTLKGIYWTPNLSQKSVEPLGTLTFIGTLDLSTDFEIW